VFAGSEPGLMRQLFENRDRPLYGSAVPMRLGRLGDADIAAYVAERFELSGRSAGEGINPMVAAAAGHPQRAMMLAHHLWERVEQGAAATLDDWRAAHESALAELHPQFDAQWRGFSTTEQRAMRAVIAGDGSPYRQRVLERLGLDKSGAQRAVRRLNESADLEQDGRRQLVVDPLFAEWIAELDTGAPEEP
jgi:uncharacterized protein